MIEFQAWPKIARLFRDCTITEKIDGTNAAIGITTHDELSNVATPEEVKELLGIEPIATVVDGYLVYAQSRKRVITPQTDNYGFARWVWNNAEALAAVLGPGLHFGEWWGSGIQRGYGLPKGEHRFSLFNTKRWEGAFQSSDHPVPGLYVVPVLYEGPFSTEEIELVKGSLRLYGSHASPGFMRPEGVVVYHHAANVMFKSTLENDEMPKGLVPNGNGVSREEITQLQRGIMRLAA